MSVVKGLENVTPEMRGCCVAVGIFDGVHWGHRAIFESVLEQSRVMGAHSAALTFDRHPAEVLAPGRAPLYISTLDQRVEMIEALGIKSVIIARFDPALASLSKQDFIEEILLGRLGAGHVVVGANFRFGSNREGDVRYLADAGKQLGFGVTVVTAVIIGGGPASSTRIRVLLAAGEVEEASKLLGRRFALRGDVIYGRRVGRTLGFPTANIGTEATQLIPARGVYVVETTIDDTNYSGVCNIGIKPTYKDLPSTVEVHLSGFEGDLYGKTIDVVFCRRLRDEMKFESPEKLMEQIREDLSRATGNC